MLRANKKERNEIKLIIWNGSRIKFETKREKRKHLLKFKWFKNKKQIK